MFGINKNRQRTFTAPKADAIALLSEEDGRKLCYEMKRLETENRLARQALVATQNEAANLRTLLNERGKPERTPTPQNESVRLNESTEIIRRLKLQIAELNRALAEAKRNQRDSDNWQRLRTEMLEGLDGNPDLAPLDRLNAKRAINLTNTLLEEKDSEIAELRTQLDAINSIGDMVYGLPNQAVDSDRQVMEERERLARLRAELQTKARETELEFSVERARLSLSLIHI